MLATEYFEEYLGWDWEYFEEYLGWAFFHIGQDISHLAHRRRRFDPLFLFFLHFGPE